MNLEIYRKEFSIFVYNEDVQMARWMKEVLSTAGYDAYFYSSRSLFQQSIYLALPHIVILPYSVYLHEMIDCVQKVSREIHIVVAGSEIDSEAIFTVAGQKFGFDFVLDPIKNSKVFVHRIDKMVEKWLITLDMEIKSGRTDTGIRASEPVFTAPDMNFIDSRKEPSFKSQTVVEVLNQPSAEEALHLALLRLTQFSGVPFCYLKNDGARESLSLIECTHAPEMKNQGLGIKYESVADMGHFLKAPSSYKLWTDFFNAVFNTEATTAITLKHAGTFLGHMVALGEMTPPTHELAESLCKVLTLKFDQQDKANFIFENIKIEKKSFCLDSKGLYEELSAEVSRARRIELPLSTLSFEIRCKDKTYLQRTSLLVSKVLKRFTRVNDHVGKVAEGRFALVFPHTSGENAAKKGGSLLGIIKAAIEEKGWTDVSVAVGVNEFPKNASDSMSLLQGSEEAAEQATGFEVFIYQKEEAPSSLHS